MDFFLNIFAVHSVLPFEVFECRIRKILLLAANADIKLDVEMRAEAEEAMMLSDLKIQNEHVVVYIIHICIRSDI